MKAISLEQVYDDLQEIKTKINVLTHIVMEDFELNESVKSELAVARKECIFISHDKVMKEFS